MAFVYGGLAACCAGVVVLIVCCGMLHAMVCAVRRDADEEFDKLHTCFCGLRGRVENLESRESDGGGRDFQEDFRAINQSLTDLYRKYRTLEMALVVRGENGVAND